MKPPSRSFVPMFVLVLICLLLLQSMAAFAAPPSPDELIGGEPDVPALPDVGIKTLGPDSPDATLKWYTVAGAGFIPYTNALTWTYGGSGCLKPTASGYWRANINLPDGAVLKQVYFGFYNTATSTTSTAFVYRYHYTGTAAVVKQLNSTSGSGGNTGYKFVSSIITAPGLTVDNYTNAYMFSWSGSGNQELCYIQVGYTPPPIFGTFLPSVRR
jgi:hypothetical protein